MAGVSVSEKYRDLIISMMKTGTQSNTVTEENVFQAGIMAKRPFIEKMLNELMRPKSRIIGLENLSELYKKCVAGKSCLILTEHYSNFDLPAIIYLLEKSGLEGKTMADSIIAIAGRKLNEESPVVSAFAAAYSRIIIYPSRSLDSISDPEILKEERKKSAAINRAALHELIRRKQSGHMILLFPAGTRYRPGRPETKQGLKEIDSYIRSFDHMVFIGLGGNLLRICPSGDMQEDIVAEDTVILKISPVVDCKEFRDRAHKEVPEGSDAKQFTVDRIMSELEKLHEEIAALGENKD